MTDLTVLDPVEVKTEITEQTTIVSNNDFMRAIFRDLPDAVYPMIVSFKGNPNNAASNAWSGSCWHKDVVEQAGGANNYFSLSSFVADQQGRYRRRKNQFSACHCIMLDDIGTKANADAMQLDPSWLIETSKDNYQAGYIFAEPISDVVTADQLMDAIVAAGLCDPGAKGPAARLARLPVAVNGKHDPVFNCRLVKWTPDLRYTVDELIAGLNLTLKPAKAKPSSSAHPTVKSGAVISEGNDVWSPKPSSNPVVDVLIKQNMYKKMIDEGQHDITCPWVSEHTGAVDSGTAYFEPSQNFPLGGFSCLHGHCSHRSIRDLLELFNIEEHMARMRSVIRVIDGALDRVVDAAERVLAEHGGYYQQNGSLVVIHTDPGTNAVRINPVGIETLTLDLAQYADWSRYDARKEAWVYKDPSSRHLAALQKKGQYPHIPVLKGIARQPYLRVDCGSLISTAQYNASSGLYGVFDPAEYSVPEAPTREQAVEALELLSGLLTEFPFATDVDRSAALCAMLSATIRTTLPVAPMFHVMAHMPGAGKSFLCALIALFATRTAGQPATFPHSEEECGKLLLAELRNSPAVIEFDNLTTDLKAFKALCTAITSEATSGRILATSDTAVVSTKVLFLSSGNNVGPVDDMLRRCLTIGLSCKEENPAQREFKNPNLLREVRENRGRYVSAALTIVRAWVVAGRPHQTLKHLAGFDDWSSLCRHPLVWLDCPDPAENMFRNMQNDPERDFLARLFGLWDSIFGSGPMRVKELVRHVGLQDSKAQDLAELLEEVAGDGRGTINTRSLGKWLASKKGRVVNGKQLVRVKSSSHGDVWAVH